MAVLQNPLQRGHGLHVGHHLAPHQPSPADGAGATLLGQHGSLEDAVAGTPRNSQGADGIYGSKMDGKRWESSKKMGIYIVYRTIHSQYHQVFF